MHACNAYDIALLCCRLLQSGQHTLIFFHWLQANGDVAVAHPDGLGPKLPVPAVTSVVTTLHHHRARRCFFCCASGSCWLQVVARPVLPANLNTFAIFAFLVACFYTFGVKTEVHHHVTREAKTAKVLTQLVHMPASQAVAVLAGMHTKFLHNYLFLLVQK